MSGPADNLIRSSATQTPGNAQEAHLFPSNKEGYGSAFIIPGRKWVALLLFRHGWMDGWKQALFSEEVIARGWREPFFFLSKMSKNGEK